MAHPGSSSHVPPPNSHHGTGRRDGLPHAGSTARRFSELRTCASFAAFALVQGCVLLLIANQLLAALALPVAGHASVAVAASCSGCHSR